MKNINNKLQNKYMRNKNKSKEEQLNGSYEERGGGYDK